MGLLTALVLFAGTVCLPVVGTGSLIYCTAFEEEEKMIEQIGKGTGGQGREEEGENCGGDRPANLLQGV